MRFRRMFRRAGMGFELTHAGSNKRGTRFFGESPLQCFCTREPGYARYVSSTARELMTTALTQPAGIGRLLNLRQSPGLICRFYLTLLLSWVRLTRLV